MKAIQVKTENGQTVYIQVSDEIPPASSARGGGKVAGGGKLAEKIKDLKDVGVAIADVCRTLQDQIQAGLAQSKPSELTLEFGVTLAGEIGFPLITKGSTEGTFQVTAKWDFSKAK